MGAILLDRTLLRRAALNTLVKPDDVSLMHIKHREKSAFEIHGITEAQLETAPTLAKVLAKLERMIVTNLPEVDLKDIVLFGSGVTFDQAFLNRAYERIGKDFPFDYHVLDLPSLYTSWFIEKHKRLPDLLTLKSMCNETGVSNDQPHSAMYDIATSVGIFRHMVGKIDE